MYIILLLLYFLTLVYVIYLTAAYYRRRHIMKKREGILRSASRPHRRALPEETAGVRRLFGVNLPPEAEVYRAEGALEWIFLTSRGNTYREFWIGGIQIQFRKGQMEWLFEGKDSARCEYVLLPGDRKMRAYPIGIDGYAIGDLFSREGGTPAPLPYRTGSFRDATPRERRALYPPRFGGLILLTLPALLSLTAGLTLLSAGSSGSPVPEALLGGGVFLGLLSLLPLFNSPRRPVGGREICLLGGTFRGVGKSSVCLLAETGERFRLPRRTVRRLAGQGYSGRGEIHFGPGRGGTSGRIVSLGEYSLDERLRGRVIKRPRTWILCALPLLFTGGIHLAVTAGGSSLRSLAALPRNIAEGPLRVEQADDVLALRGGETVDFRNLSVHPRSTYSSEYLILDDPEEPYRSLSPAQRERLGDIFAQWEELEALLGQVIRFGDGTPLRIGETLPPGTASPDPEDDIIESVGEDRDVNRMDLAPLACADPDRLVAYLSRKDTPLGRIPLDDHILGAIYTGRHLNNFIQWLVIQSRGELARRAGTIWDVEGGDSPYPLLCYADFKSLSPSGEGPGEADPFAVPFGELIRESLLRSEGGVLFLNGLYYMDSRIDYSRVGPSEGDGYGRIGFDDYSRYLLLIRKLALSLSFLAAGLLVLASGLLSRLGD